VLARTPAERTAFAQWPRLTNKQRHMLRFVEFKYESEVTVATNKHVYDISPAKTDSYKPVDQF